MDFRSSRRFLHGSPLLVCVSMSIAKGLTTASVFLAVLALVEFGLGIQASRIAISFHFARENEADSDE